MAIITYPLNGVTYDASDAETYFSTRKSGVYSSDEHFGVTISGNHQLTVAPGLAWVQNDDFKGKSIAVTEAVKVDFDISETALARIDLLVLRFDANENRSYFAVKKGSPAGSPVRPEVTRNASVYELGLYAVRMPASAAAITEADITSLILDETYCGVMRDGVTGIPTAQIQEQAMGIMAGLLDSLSAELETIVGATVTTDAGGGDPYCNIVFSGDTEKTVLFEFHNLKGPQGDNGVSVTHTWNGDVLTFTSASGTTSIDFLKNLKTRREVKRFTASGTFNPANYPSATGLYDIVLLGGGGSGGVRWTTGNYGTGGGSAAGFLCAFGIPLKSGTSYTATIGAGGAAISASAIVDGNAGGSTSFAGFTVPGGNGGKSTGTNLSAANAVVAGVTFLGFTSEGGTGTKGGDSFYGVGGACTVNANAAAGGYGAGGGGIRTQTSGQKSGKGGDGLVIIYGY